MGVFWSTAKVMHAQAAMCFIGYAHACAYIDMQSTCICLAIHVTVEGRNQTLFTLLLLKKKSSKGRKFYFKASVMTKVNFEKNVNKV